MIIIVGFGRRALVLAKVARFWPKTSCFGELFTFQPIWSVLCQRCQLLANLCSFGQKALVLAKAVRFCGTCPVLAKVVEFCSKLAGLTHVVGFHPRLKGFGQGVSFWQPWSFFLRTSQVLARVVWV